MNEQTCCLEELLEEEGGINAKYATGFTALLHAISARRHDYVKRLIAAGADVNLESTRISESTSTAQILTPVTYCINAASANCLKILLDAGANVLFKDERGNTPLIEAVYGGNKAIVQLLIEAGSNINAENNDGEAALYLAVKHGHEESDSKPSKEGVVIAEKHMNTPLSVYTSIVYVLLAVGAHLNNTSTGLNPVTPHLKPKELASPNMYILKMLSAAGLDIEKEVKSSSNLKTLQQSVRDYLRQYLKQIHPDTNLIFAVLHLNLPCRIQSFLLFSATETDDSILDDIEESLLFKTSEADVGEEFHLRTSEKDIQGVLKLIEDGSGC